MKMHVIELGAQDIESNVEALSCILARSVNGGAAISFMAPFPQQEAACYWSNDVLPEVVAGRRVLFAGVREGQVVGTVQLITAMPPNQSHRCEIAKMIVHPDFRRLGVGHLLMTHALDRARELDKTLVTLDTRSGDVAEPLYAKLGFEIAGRIPDYAWNPDGRARHATTYMYRQI
ncbi:GNAT family N-acetyltransferase [Acetobacter cerevisiae]|uniref:Acetyltransferase n=1 Tax=Acetobacter cerevisiae TaxID=178900 RepID=A0A149VB51_9PROT|nr:GNAT family N-acetyltransferase [Acetobacter cerevisiae]KXV77408.1 acetyltransferase [Acetobacter cerevisiae]